jgi:hypothetical protein
MRILIVDTCYPAFLKSHYARRFGLADAPYETQWRALMDRYFGTCDSYSHYLGRLGHVAHEVVVNCTPLQHAWARDHNVRLSRLTRLGPLFAQVEEFVPDVVYVQDVNALSPRTLRKLRGQRRLVVGQIASAAPPASQLAPFQLLLTSFPHFVTRFRSLGIASEYFRLGFDPRVLSRLRVESPRMDAVFVGALGRARHSRGNELLERVARQVPIQFWGYGVDAWPSDSAMRSRYHGEAWGLDMFSVLARSRIAINRHIDVAEDYANNMRLFEATGVGTLLLTDEKRNLADLFEPDNEVATYADEAELVEKIGYFLLHEEERAAIARAGQERTLREHTYEHRMRELVEVVARYVP